MLNQRDLFLTHGSPIIQHSLVLESPLVRIICHLLLLLLANAIFLNSSSSSLPFHKPYSKEQLSLDAQSRPEALQLIWQSDMDEPLPDRSRTPTIHFSPLPIATLRSPHTPPRSQPRNRPRSPSSSSPQISRASHISTLVAESLRLDFDDDEDDLPLHVEFSTSQSRERQSPLASSFAALPSYSPTRPSTPSPQRRTFTDYNPADHRPHSPGSDLWEEGDSFIDSLDPPFEPYAESSIVIVQSPSAQMPSSPHRRLYPDQSGGSAPSSSLAQRSISRPSPMGREASNSVPHGTIDPFMGGLNVINSPAASSWSSQRGQHIEYYAGAPLQPRPVAASAPEWDDVEENDNGEVDAPNSKTLDNKTDGEVKNPPTKILIFRTSLTMTLGVSRLHYRHILPG